MTAAPPDLGALAHAPVDQALARLRAAGWRDVGVGDWARALADPGDSWCARVVPFDPAYRLYADDVLAGPPNRLLPHVEAIVSLAGEGYVVLMERLWPAHAPAASALCAALGSPKAGEDPELTELRARVAALDDRGAARFPRLWGGSDVRPGNVLADAAGRLKLVDPVYLAGQRIAEAIGAGDTQALAGLSRAQLEAFLTIAGFHRDEDRYEGVEELRECLRRLRLAP